jgi:SSS family solute:Na+ symporter
MLLASSCYVIVSKLTCRVPHNMDKLLHRGQYAIAGDAVPLTGPKRNLMYRIMTFGIDEQFSRSDKWITIGVMVWSLFWFAVFIVGTVWNLAHRWSNGTWATYYLVTGIFLPLGIGALTTIWFTWGCTHDMIQFFRRLREERVDVHDDGTVSQEHGLGVPILPVAALETMGDQEESIVAPAGHNKGPEQRIR